ncbi:MAG: phage tail family protein [Treponemataceae bacterium]
MRIFHGETEIKIPKWFTVSGGTLKIDNKTQKVNGAHGERIIGDETFAARTLKCTGTLDAVSYSDVEILRSKITDLLAAKILRVYRGDYDTIYYNCILDGDVSVTYYNGINLARILTMSFTLKTIEPFGYEKKKVLFRGAHFLESIFIKSNFKIYPNILFYGNAEYSGDLFSCGGNKLTLTKNVILEKNEALLFTNGRLLKTTRKTKTLEDVSHYVGDGSLVQPICFRTGENKLTMIQGSCIIFYHEMYK